MADNTNNTTLFPVFDVPEIDTTTQSEQRVYKPSVYFDFASGDFKRDGAYKMVTATGKEAYMQWCQKVVMTERDACLAYTTDIGVEKEAALSKGDRAAVESALEKTITEALMVNNHTEYVRSFEFTWEGDNLWMSFTAKGKEWEETTISVSYP